MTSRRTQKAAEAVREVVGMAILRDLKDPRVRNVTVTFVEVSPDMRQAKVHVSIMGTETEQNLCLRGLQSAAGFLQSKLAANIDMRYTPKITFVIDQGVKRSIEVMRILQQLRPAEEVLDTDETDDSETYAEELDETDDDVESDEAADDEFDDKLDDEFAAADDASADVDSGEHHDATGQHRTAD
jgi:ribosome-binding factor A